MSQKVRSVGKERRPYLHFLTQRSQTVSPVVRTSIPPQNAAADAARGRPRPRAGRRLHGHLVPFGDGIGDQHTRPEAQLTVGTYGGGQVFDVLRGGPRAHQRWDGHRHAWECGFLFEEATRTLLCGDLFIQPGAEHPALTGGDILGPSEAMRGELDYGAHAASTRPTLEELAGLGPRTLACMQGSAWTGDGASLIRDLAALL